MDEIILYNKAKQIKLIPVEIQVINTGYALPFPNLKIPLLFNEYGLILISFLALLGVTITAMLSKKQITRILR